MPTPARSADTIRMYPARSGSSDAALPVAGSVVIPGSWSTAGVADGSGVRGTVVAVSIGTVADGGTVVAVVVGAVVGVLVGISVGGAGVLVEVFVGVLVGGRGGLVGVLVAGTGEANNGSRGAW
jgi:hypothetical protein